MSGRIDGGRATRRNHGVGAVRKTERVADSSSPGAGSDFFRSGVSE
jgi:hypothetical protein